MIELTENNYQQCNFPSQPVPIQIITANSHINQSLQFLKSVHASLVKIVNNYKSKHWLEYSDSPISREFQYNILLIVSDVLTNAAMWLLMRDAETFPDLCKFMFHCKDCLFPFSGVSGIFTCFTLQNIIMNIDFLQTRRLFSIDLHRFLQNTRYGVLTISGRQSLKNIPPTLLILIIHSSNIGFRSSLALTRFCIDRHFIVLGIDLLMHSFFGSEDGQQLITICVHEFLIVGVVVAVPRAQQVVVAGQLVPSLHQQQLVTVYSYILL